MAKKLDGSGQKLVPSQDFVEISGMDMMTFYLLFEDRKLPVVRKERGHVYIDINDIRARRWLPDYEPKGLFK